MFAVFVFFGRIKKMKIMFIKRRKEIKIIAVFVVVFLFLFSIFFLFSKTNKKETSVQLELDRYYINEDLGYQIGYQEGATIKEIMGSYYFHSALSSEELLNIFGDWSGYQQIFMTKISGDSSIYSIDGKMLYEIDKYIYLNKEKVSVEEWYNTAVLAEALVSKRIDNSAFVKLRNKIKKNDLSESDKEEFFDPWAPKGTLISVDKKNVLKMNAVTENYFYDGFQYYIVAFDKYIFVFRFGYGGSLPREMWKENDAMVKAMIASLKKI